MTEDSHHGSLLCTERGCAMRGGDVNTSASQPLFGRDAATDGPSEVGLFVPVEEVFPGTEGSERALIKVLATLSCDDTLFQCARTNILISGFGDFDNKPRQEQALAQLGTREHISCINNFARRHKTSGTPAVFFRGQLLELMRWAARYCKNLPGDGRTYEDPAFRERFVKAALIASGLWGKRTYRDKLSAGGDVGEVRQRALGALRKGVEESNVAPHFGVAIARGLKLFTDYLPKHCPGFAYVPTRTGPNSSPGPLAVLLPLPLTRYSIGRRLHSLSVT